MTHAPEPPRWSRDDAADPFARQLLSSARDDGPTPQRLMKAPAAIATLIAAQTISNSAAAVVTTAAAGTAKVSSGSVGVLVGSSANVTASVPLTATTAMAGTSAFAATSATTLTILPLLVKSTLIGLAIGGSVMASAHHATKGEGASTPPSVAVAGVQSNARPHASSDMSLGSTVKPLPRGDRASTTPSIAELALAPVTARAGVTSDTDGAEHRFSSQYNRLREGTITAPGRAVSQSARNLRTGSELGTAETTPSEPFALSREVQLLDEARRALELGNPRLALLRLGNYDDLQRKLLGPESVVLRVRVLLALDRRADARQLVDAFCANAPNAPQTQILRQLVRD